MYKNITDKEFVKILQNAVNGNIEEIYKIIEIYEGLILKHSVVNGTYNQECRDYTEDRIIKEIKKFRKI